MSEETEAKDAAPTIPPSLPKPPVVQNLSINDIVDALSAGLADFRAKPAYGLFFGLAFALGGFAIISFSYLLDLAYLSYPLGAGFALIGPFVAVGLYEVSRRREKAQPMTWGDILGVIYAQRNRELVWMSFVTLFIMMMWMYQVRLLLALFLGLDAPAGLPALIEMVFTTPEGLLFLFAGHVVGAVLALVLFSLTVVSFPILLDRDVDFITAMITSVKTVTTNPVPMVGWAFVVTVTLLISISTLFVALILVLPVLGHTTWHIYRRAVAAEEIRRT